MYGIGLSELRRREPALCRIGDAELAALKTVSYRSHSVRIWSWQIAVFALVFGPVWWLGNNVGALDGLTDPVALGLVGVAYFFASHRATVRVVADGIAESRAGEQPNRGRWSVLRRLCAAVTR